MKLWCGYAIEKIVSPIVPSTIKKVTELIFKLKLSQALSMRNKTITILRLVPV